MHTNTFAPIKLLPTGVDSSEMLHHVEVAGMTIVWPTAFNGKQVLKELDMSCGQTSVQSTCVLQWNVLAELVQVQPESTSMSLS